MVQDIRIRITEEDNLKAVDKRLEDISKEELNVAKNAKTMSEAIKKGSNEADKSTKDLNSSIKGIGLTIAAAFTVDSILGFAQSVIATRGEFQKLEAVLTNTLGSQGKAQRALSDINKFAASTNFGVVELTNSFVKLANSGFVPTIDELGNLADVANSTGKSFDMLTEAIIDAQTGEFERLKEFGIRASKEGDNVKFSFKGVQTQVKFTNEAIRDYIVSLGDLNGVQGATEAISRTLVGQVSNLGDSWDQLLNTIGQQSEGVLVGTITLLNEAIMAANELLKTQEQQGTEQEQNRLSSRKEYVKAIISEGMAVEFLKGKNESYVKLFKEGRDETVKAEFAAFSKMAQAREEAAAKTLRYLKLEVEQEVEITRGLTIAEARTVRERNRELLAAAQEYYDDLTALKKAQADPTQKQLDDEYKKELARLKELEQNDLKEAVILDKDKKDLLDIEIRYNELRQNAFKRFNQSNMEELRAFGLDERAERKAQLDYLRAQEASYDKNIRAEEDAKLEIEKEYLDSKKRYEDAEREDRLAKEKDAFDRQIDLILYLEREEQKAREKKKREEQELRNTLIAGAQNIVNQLAENDRISNNNEMERNEKLRQNELALNEDNKDAQLAINQKYDEKNRELKRRQWREDKQLAEFNAVIATAQAIAKALPNIPLSVAVGFLGAAQIAIIESREEPTFAKGGFTGAGNGLPDKTGERRAGIVHENEFVFDKHKTQKYRTFFEDIHRDRIKPEDIVSGNNYSLGIDYGAMQGAFTKSLKTQPRNEIHINERGFVRYMREDNKREEYRNKRYSSN